MKDESEIRNEKIYEKVMDKYLRENNASIHTTREVAILCMEEVEQKPTDEFKTICPECTEETPQEELDMFSGLCEECTNN